MKNFFRNPETYVSLLTLTAMEVVLGIDNIVFISILAGKLPPRRATFSEAHRPPARPRSSRRAPLCDLLGDGADGATLLRGGSWFCWAQPDSPHGRPFSLIGKATHEIHDKFEATDDVKAAAPSRGAFWAIIAQIIVLDAVFSIDSVITAVGMVDEISIMVVATLISVGVMLAFAARLAILFQRHPSMKVLALSFLILIGVLLVAEGMGQHIAKGYVYFAMAFSLVVELLNMRLRTKSSAVSGGPTTKV